VDTVALGRSGLQVSVAGLGCGGHSRLGQSYGATEEQSIGVVRRALELGINFIDTARVYGTEEIVGKALDGVRDELVISSKVLPQDSEGPLSAERFRESLEKSLRRLRTDCVDVFHLHGVSADLRQHCLDELVPEMLQLRDAGKLRFLAISEQFAADPGHDMLQRATADGCWDVMMVGFNLLNPSARDRVFPATIAEDIGVLVMFAVRRALSRTDELARVITELVEGGHLDSASVDRDNPLGFLVHEGGAESVVDAAYRFTRHEPGTHVILTGTGNVAHLEENVASIQRGSLPDADLARLQELFGKIDFLSGN